MFHRKVLKLEAHPNDNKQQTTNNFTITNTLIETTTQKSYLRWTITNDKSTVLSVVGLTTHLVASFHAVLKVTTNMPWGEGQSMSQQHGVKSTARPLRGHVNLTINGHQWKAKITWCSVVFTTTMLHRLLSGLAWGIVSLCSTLVWGTRFEYLAVESICRPTLHVCVDKKFNTLDKSNHIYNLVRCLDSNV